MRSDFNLVLGSREVSGNNSIFGSLSPAPVTLQFDSPVACQANASPKSHTSKTGRGTPAAADDYRYRQSESQEMRTTKIPQRPNVPLPPVRPVRTTPHPSATPLFTLFMLAGFVLAPRAANADFIYNWHEDDTQTVIAQLVVKNDAQVAGQITLPDVTSFTFTGPGSFGPNSFTTPDLVGVFPIPISTVDASPSSPASFLNAFSPAKELIIDLNSSYATPFSQRWSVLPTFDSGLGHWSISQTSPVPEPSTAVVAAVAAVCGLAYYGWRRTRWDRRRQRPVGSPDATE